MSCVYRYLTLHNVNPVQVILFTALLVCNYLVMCLQYFLSTLPGIVMALCNTQAWLGIDHKDLDCHNSRTVGYKIDEITFTSKLFCTTQCCRSTTCLPWFTGPAFAQ